MFDTQKSILQEVSLPELKARNVQLFIKRDDLIDALVSGNKWRKLKYNIQIARQNKREGILTFGGAYSNHLLATASACQKEGLNAIGIVRGDELNENSNDLLRNCAQMGMKLIFISRGEYLMRNEKTYHEELTYEHPNYHIVPEGGANYYGMIGCQEIMKEIDQQVAHVFLAQGTTTTSAGILLSLNEQVTLHGVPVLKGFDAVGEMKQLFGKSGFDSETTDELLEQCVIHPEAHCGGYGQYTSELLDFMEYFFRETQVPLDPVYTGKALFELINWVKSADIRNEKVLFIHTGGIAGGKSIEKKEGRIFS